MKLSKLIIAGALALSAAVSFAQAAGPKTGIVAVDKYRSITFIDHMMCAIAADTMLINMELLDFAEYVLGPVEWLKTLRAKTLK